MRTHSHLNTYASQTKKSTTTVKINGNYLLFDTYMLCMCICALCECLLSGLCEDKKNMCALVFVCNSYQITDYFKSNDKYIHKRNVNKCMRFHV